jgi:hypothetical protein
MKTLILTAAIVAALAAPSMLPAADQSSTVGAVACRAARPNEISNASLGTTPLRCHKIDMVHIKGAITKLKGMEPRMDQDERAQVEALEKMITQGTLYG